MRHSRLYRQYVLACFLAVALGTGLKASAHLMVAQKGTLNLSGDGAYLVLSVPVSAFRGVDDNNDGLLSVDELRLNAQRINQELDAGLTLSDGHGACPLQGLMLNLSPKDSIEGHPADQLIVMGRYALRDSSSSLTIRTTLWGAGESEQRFGLTVTKNLKDEQVVLLSPQQPEARLYVPPLEVFRSFVALGLQHVLEGFDHLLFLLLVVSAGWGLKRLVAALSVFTLGHGLTLVAIVYGGLTVPSRMVEPAIAVTIVGLGLFDLFRRRESSNVARVGFVFVCSLIHGLGLGGALNELGLNSAHQGVTLLGFNLGIELGQLMVAAVATLVFRAAYRMFGPQNSRLVASFSTACAVVVGGVWFVVRLFAP